MYFKLLQKEQFRKQWKQLMILLETKLLIKLQKIQKRCQNNSEINGEQILRERYISPEQGQKIIDDLRLI